MMGASRLVQMLSQSWRWRPHSTSSRNCETTISGTPMGMPLVSTTMPSLSSGMTVKLVALPVPKAPEWL